LHKNRDKKNRDKKPMKSVMTAFARRPLAKTVVAVLVCFLFATNAWGAYVLPYPSYMPGHRLYPLSRLLDQLKSYWYWGNIAQFKYHLSLADKYVVEAKTLFEYGQYPLAMDALRRSNQEVRRLPELLGRTKQEGKDTTHLEQTLRGAMEAHTVILAKLATELPKEFLWQSEKKSPTLLPLEQILKDAIEVRQGLIVETLS